MSDARKKFQELLRDLFQFDCADLDFGIYRIMNQKRDLIEKFIEKDLLDAVAKELKKDSLKEQGDLADQLEKLAAKIREDIADDAVDADGKLGEKHKDTKLGKQYIELQKKAGGAVSVSELESQVFNHLWAFFSRYYDNGDFLSIRRYSRREKYSIPYNGEEVYLHWANRDQYYIKTGEYFTDYQWKAGDVSVLFKLIQAETEKDNVKADTKRFFVPKLDAVTVEKKLVTIPFEYRGLTEQEGISFGKKNQQDAIIMQALESLPKRKVLREAPEALGAMLTEYRKTEKDESVSRMEHHLRRYTGKNTRDYFIHKDLEGFLTRELDFYLKNEVLALDDLASGGSERAESWFELLHAIRAIGGKIIMFVAQIENFQKRIFEKRKFVTETNYCFTLDRVPKVLWPKILKNKPQIEEWKKLYSIQELKGYSDPLKSSFLESWPSMMIDTKYFVDDHEFLDSLLSAQNDLEESLGGLLIHSENFQALNLLLPRFKEQVKCTYIDPPYNAKSSEIIYKNSYKHSSWLSLMQDRIVCSKALLPNPFVYIIAVDEVENSRLTLMLSKLFNNCDDVCISIIHNPTGQQGDNFSFTHDFAHFVYPSNVVCIGMENRNDSMRESDPDIRPLRNVSSGDNHLRASAANCFYPIFIKEGKIIGFGDVCDDDFHPKNINIEKHNGIIEVYPIDPSGVESKWVFARDTVETIIDELTAEYDQKKKAWDIIRKKTKFRYKSLWEDKRYSANSWGSVVLNNMLPNNPFTYPKSIYTVRDCIDAGLNNYPEGVVLDYFAGSGTTAHAVINLNREDNGKRKYILVEVAEYYDTVLKPRIEKIIYSADWKDGKPSLTNNEKSAGISHAFKYIRLESYEDALGNIAFEESQGALKFDDYVLRYMLEFETRKSETLLNVEKLAAPFSYQLEIMEGGERIKKPVDLPETFNYLLGLKVVSRQVHMRDGKHRYLVIRGMTNPNDEGGERKVVVIWRDVTGWKNADFKADAEFVKKENLADSADEVFVNADGVIPDVKILDPVFKERMFAPVNV